ncbi:MAG: rhodanese-like domain-containing protein [Acidimicrobiia bacterium]|nr:rhodanese-like domain-containing protein [Acidimicrobiia bacterium]
MSPSKTMNLLILFIVICLFGAACGSEDSTETTVAAAPETTVTTAAPTTTTTAAPTTTTTVAPTTTTTEPIDETAVLAAHITAQFADWKPVMTAETLFENLSDGDESNDPFILSVRAPDVYALGHIEGAYNIPWKSIVDAENLAKLPTDEQIVVYCYTGHTGQVAAALLRILGYDAVNLKFGMMGWTADDEILGTGRYAAAPGYPTETEANELTVEYDPPVVATGKTEAMDIALAAAQGFLADWTPVTKAEGLFENLSDGDEANDPFILSVRAPDVYALGHVEGAFDIPWKAVAAPESLAMLPTDEQIVVYCYTGHTGQASATALALLGYDAINMKFGMMGWTDDDEILGTGRYSGAPDYPTETEANVLP